MTQPLPIRPDVAFQIDGEREMIDYLIGQVKEHVARWGEAPHGAAVVLASDKGRSVHSFSMRPDGDRLASCSAAAALLLQRGVE